MIRGMITDDGVLHLIGETPTDRYAIIQWSKDDAKKMTINDWIWCEKRQIFYKSSQPDAKEEMEDEIVKAENNRD